jgi:hypothetical protein
MKKKEEAREPLKTERPASGRPAAFQGGYRILSQSSRAGPGPGFFHWLGISEVR